MKLTDYLTLGRSGLRVSPICLGTMTFGKDWGWGSDVKDSEAILDAFLGRGGNFIDTANVYTKGHSEKIIGDHIGHDPAKRDRVVIATKFFAGLFKGDPNGGGGHRKSIMAACEQSLRRLRTEYIDLYWLHCWDMHTPIDETMRTLDDLVRAGKVRYIGFSDTPAWKVAQAQTIAQFRGYSPLVALQIEYSLLERTVEGELIPMAQELGLGVTPWSPLKYGVLTGKYKRGDHGKHEAGRGERVTQLLNDKTYDLLDEIHRIAKATGSTPSRVSLAWLQARPGVASIIIGARTQQQLDDNLASLDVQLTPEQIKKLDDLTTPKLDFPYDFVANNAPFMQGGTTINGRPSQVWPMLPTGDGDRY